MEAEDFDSNFVLDGDPSIPLFPLISGENNPNLIMFNSSVFSDKTCDHHHYTTTTTTPRFNSPVYCDGHGDMLNPTLLSYYCNSESIPLTTLPPPSNFFNEDSNCYNTPPPSFNTQQLGFANSAPPPPPQLCPPHMSAQPYDFFSSVPSPVESAQPYDLFSSVPESSHSVLNDTAQTLESVLENVNAVSKKPKRSTQMKKPKQSSSSTSLIRRQKISERLKCLRKLMPWVTSRMDTATVLEESYKYIKILQEQIRALLHTRTAASFNNNHDYHHSNDNSCANGVSIGRDGGVSGAQGLSREQIMEMVLKVNMGQNVASF